MDCLQGSFSGEEALVEAVFALRDTLRSTPLPVTVTTRIITFLVGDPYKPSFPTVTGRGPHPRYDIFSEAVFSFWGL